MAERCKHGMDLRFCSLCNPKRTRAAPRGYTAGPTGTSNHTLESIVQFLNAAQTRATYVRWRNWPVASRAGLATA